MNNKERRERIENIVVGAIVGGLIGLLALIMSAESVRNPQPHYPMYTSSELSLYLSRIIAENPLPTIGLPAAAGAIVVFIASRKR